MAVTIIGSRCCNDIDISLFNDLTGLPLFEGFAKFVCYRVTKLSLKGKIKVFKLANDIGYNFETIVSLYQPPRGKTNNVVYEQVRHKPTCTVTEKS